MDKNGLILSLDTSHLRGSSAVSTGRELLSAVFFNASDTHSATLLPAVDSSLRMAGTALEEIEKFAVVIGPGSFTGLRIGLSTIKAFASVRKKPVYTVTSLELLASAFPYSALPVASVIDARRNQVYFGLYNTSSGIPEQLIEPVAVGPAGVPGLISSEAVPGKTLLCGTGALRYLDILKSENLIFSGEGRVFPSASFIPGLLEGREPVSFERLPGLEPLYIRPPDARPSVKLMNKRG
ncbi:MAG: tRNA (adenosine(37)-N6)-threonylcarbamoyltransferase complex dimerization subunit type 1 TsaB [Candidatus Krumholzibacteriales bacterium]